MSNFEIMLTAILILIVIAFLKILRINNEVAEKQEILTERLDAILKTLNLYRQGELEPVETVQGYTDNKGKWVIMRKSTGN